MTRPLDSTNGWAGVARAEPCPSPVFVEKSSMKPKTVILLVVAVSCGLAASYMTSKLLAERKQAPPPEPEKVKILVAKIKVPKYQKLSEPEKFFEVKERSKSEAPKSYLSRLEDVKGKRVNKEIKAEVHISPEDVVDKLNTALPVPEGYGAIGVKINAASAVSFFVTPGDKVDIILTQKGDNASALTILRDVLVLSVGKRTTPPDGSKETDGTMEASTVTVAVHNDEAQLIRVAETQGDLSLFLKKDDGDTSDDRAARKITVKDLERAARNQEGKEQPVVTKPEVDPNKLPFDLKLDEIEKAGKKEEPEVKVELPKPVHTIVVRYENGPPQRFDYYLQPDGSVTREVPKPVVKTPEKEPEKPK